MDEKDTGRLEAFSDGVFAVAITLLVLDIRFVPVTAPGSLPPGDAAVWQTVRDQLPMLAAFITSFFTIGIMWLNHHRLFQHIKKSDTGLLFVNLLLLLIIVFIPVPTALLADYLVRPDQHAAAVIYSGTFFLMACCFNLLWRYASYHNRLLGKNVDTHSVAAISRQYLSGPLTYLIVFGIAWINTPLCIFFSFVLALFFAVPARSLRPLSKDNSAVEMSQEEA